MYRRTCVSVALLCALVSAGAAHGLTIDTTSTGSPFDLSTFGEPNAATYGQVFLAPTVETQLDSFTFFLEDLLNTDFVDFAAYVMAWDGAAATGSILYESPGVTTTNNDGADGYESFTFTTGGLNLAAGSQYIAFISASEYFDTVGGQALVAGRLGNPYTDGQFYFLFNGDNTSAWTSSPWLTNGGSFDMSFEMNFSEPGPPIPEPATAMLFGLGITGMCIVWRKRQNA